MLTQASAEININLITVTVQGPLPGALTVLGHPTTFRP